jgi:hypothetical protein
MLPKLQKFALWAWDHIKELSRDIVHVAGTYPDVTAFWVIVAVVAFFI